MVTKRSWKAAFTLAIVLTLCYQSVGGALSIRFSLSPRIEQERAEDWGPRNDPWDYRLPGNRDPYAYYDHREDRWFRFAALSRVVRWERTPYGRVVVLSNGMQFRVVRPGYRWPYGEYVYVYVYRVQRSWWLLGYRNGRFGYWRTSGDSGAAQYRLEVDGQIYRAGRVDD